MATQPRYVKQSAEFCKDNSWSELYKSRRAIAQRFGKIFALPLAHRASDVLVESVTHGARVLEIGAGEHGMQSRLARDCPTVLYQSMDVDPQGDHDYHDLSEIPHTFDCVFALEVVEHLRIDEIGPWLARIGELLRPRGTLVLSTPNTYYPPAYLRDATHRTPLCYDELGGLIETAGLRVERIVRIYHDPVPRALARRYLFGWLFRLIGIDFARQIVVVAKKP